MSIDSLVVWLDRDPIGEAGGINLYQFVLNSPMFWVDRDGLDIWKIEYPDFPGHQVIVGDNPDTKGSVRLMCVVAKRSATPPFTPRSPSSSCRKCTPAAFAHFKPAELGLESQTKTS